MDSVRTKMYEASMAALGDFLSEDTLHFVHDAGMQRVMGDECVYYVSELPSGEKVRIQAAVVEHVRNTLTITDFDDKYVVDMYHTDGRLQAEIGDKRLVNSPYVSNPELIDKVERLFAEAVRAKRKPFDFEGAEPAASLSPR